MDWGERRKREGKEDCEIQETQAGTVQLVKHFSCLIKNTIIRCSCLCKDIGFVLFSFSFEITGTKWQKNKKINCGYINSNFLKISYNHKTIKKAPATYEAILNANR